MGEDKMVVSIKWLAHASFQIKTGEKVIYIDLEKHGKATEKADLVLVTHSHSDHFDMSKIEQVRTEDTLIVAPEDCIAKVGGNSRTLKPGDEMAVDGIKLKAVEAYNVKRFRSPGRPFHPKGFGVGYLITVENRTIYHAGDTDFIPEMKELEHVDLALLPSGDTYTMDNVDAAEASLAINPKAVIPMHRWNTNPEGFRKRVEADSSVKVLLLKEEEEYHVA